MPRRSLDSAKIRLFKLDYELVMKRLREYAEKARAKGAKAVILIGSLARGNYTAFSDADVVIIADNVPKNPIKRLGEFMDPKFPIDLEPRVYTTKEILNMARKKKRVIREIVEYGILLIGEEELIEKIKREFLTNES